MRFAIPLALFFAALAIAAPAAGADNDAGAAVSEANPRLMRSVLGMGINNARMCISLFNSWVFDDYEG